VPISNPGARRGSGPRGRALATGCFRRTQQIGGERSYSRCCRRDFAEACRPRMLSAGRNALPSAPLMGSPAPEGRWPASRRVGIVAEARARTARRARAATRSWSPMLDPREAGDPIARVGRPGSPRDMRSNVPSVRLCGKYGGRTCLRAANSGPAPRAVRKACYSRTEPIRPSGASPQRSKGRDQPNTRRAPGRAYKGVVVSARMVLDQPAP